MSVDRVKSSLSEAASALEALRSDEEKIALIDEASELIANALRAGGKVISCGNGGSMCDAMHFAEELTGRYRDDRAAYAAIAISDPSHLTCVANDYGFERVFSRYVEAHGKREDVLLAISTSGTSANVLAAAKEAKNRGMKVVALTGSDASALGDAADVHIATPGGKHSDRVQELHIKVIHILIELVEERLA
ncbi:MAG TPA: D-sedoheptulose 7-phosphate isomerase [Fimbriimonadaceae bacterium]|nr:D-sedoheptulose 7-phosphate isomerase [Fimbriimonadaceae bacterium]